MFIILSLFLFCSMILCGTCLRLVAFGYIWMHLDSFGCVWMHLDVFGCVWLHFETFWCHFVRFIWWLCCLVVPTGFRSSGLYSESCTTPSVQSNATCRQEEHGWYASVYLPASCSVHPISHWRHNFQR